MSGVAILGCAGRALRVAGKYKFDTSENTDMGFVELNVEEDFERPEWDVISNSRTEFRVRRGSWIMAARYESEAGMYIIELANGDYPVFEDGFHFTTEARGAILALRQIVLQMDIGCHSWLQ